MREELKESQIVIDRFHVTRHYRDGVDEFRKAELKRLKQDLAEEEYHTLKRRCYGIFNLKHLFQRIYLNLEGYHLFLPNLHIWPHHANSY